jgi:glutamate racemase
MERDDKRAIGLFDSGVGGLTVAHAIRQLMPSESLIYFGDTAHLPYGDKSAESIISYSRRITSYLIEKGAKMVLIACNSASASAFPVLKEEFGDTIFLMDVIEPVVDYVARGKYSRVGVIGTNRTITSGTYEKRFSEKSPSTRVVSMATPLFVPMIEEGFIFDDVSNAILRAYLAGPRLDTIEALVLGCTHYPIIRQQIARIFNFDVEVIDSARIVALALKKELEERGLANRNGNPSDIFYVSDYTPYFSRIAKMFFESDINLERAAIWS